MTLLLTQDEKDMVEKAIHIAWARGFQQAVDVFREIADLTPDETAAELIHTVADAVEKAKPAPPMPKAGPSPGVGRGDRPYVFQDHHCPVCQDGRTACREGNPNRCGHPIARNE